ncbi:MAG: class I SAM-dependent RNA methyltransferase [Ilumatobacteraceae bacterium]
MQDDASLRHSGIAIERIVAGGEGLGHLADGRVVFVKGGVPGDVATIDLVDDRRDWARAALVNVEVESPQRMEPTCRARRSGCGGCDWAEIGAEHQLGLKADIVTEALRRTARIEHQPMIGASVTRNGYRSGVRVVGTASHQAGFRRTSDDETIAAGRCEIAVPALAEMIESITIDPGLEVTLRASVATGEVTARWDERLGNVDGLPSSVDIGFSASLIERVAGVDFVVSAGSFFQSGPQAADLLVDAVARFAPELSSARAVVDAYGGIGLFAATVVSPESDVWVVETSRSALADARINLDGRPGRTQLVRSEFGKWRPTRGDLRPEVIIADPARTGLGRPGVAAVVRSRPEVLVLVSCDPVSFARDAALLEKEGFGLERCEVLDLFPGTHHVEVVSRFVRAGTLTA